MPRDTIAPTAGVEIRLAGVSKRWGASTVVDHIDLTIAAGSFCVVLGPSGCGKTTCLRMIAGLETPSAGQIVIGGRDVTSIPPAARGVAMVFQSYALFPHLTVAENILFGLRARRVPAAERRARLADAAEMLGLGALLGRRPAQLSGGQQQRVALGRAVVARAPVCLMDEPLSNLDALLRTEMRRELLDLQRRLGITVVYVTHDQTEAMSMADQVVLMRAGRIEQDGPPAALYQRPATQFAAAFVGQPPMNLFPPALLPAGMAPGTAAMVGLRPEALRLGQGGVAATLRLCEFLGAETVLDCDVGGARMLARLPGRCDLAPGTPIHLAFDPTALHRFGPDGDRLPDP